MNFKRIDIKLSDYKNLKIETNPIENYPEWYNMYNKPLKEDTWTKILHRFFGDNRKAFRQIFGVRYFIYKTEYNLHCWAIEYKGQKILIFTAKGKGTGVEIILDKSNKDDPEPKIVIDFIIELTKELKELQ